MKITDPKQKTEIINSLNSADTGNALLEQLEAILDIMPVPEVAEPLTEPASATVY